MHVDTVNITFDNGILVEKTIAWEIKYFYSPRFRLEALES